MDDLAIKFKTVSLLDSNDNSSDNESKINDDDDSLDLEGILDSDDDSYNTDKKLSDNNINGN